MFDFRAVNLLKLLEAFCLISGRYINMRKSIILGTNVEEAFIRNLAAALGCEVGDWPIKHLGLSLGGSARRADF